MSNDPPNVFFRVHHRDAFTSYSHDSGFQASCKFIGYLPHQWLNKQMFEGHATGAIDPEGINTPYISIFDDFARAHDLAESWKAKGFEDVFIAEIRPGPLASGEVAILFDDRVVRLEAWKGENDTLISTTAVKVSPGVEENKGDVAEWFMISTTAVRVSLGVEENKSDVAEWFMIEKIPAGWISVVEPSLVRTSTNGSL